MIANIRTSLMNMKDIEDYNIIMIYMEVKLALILRKSIDII